MHLMTANIANIRRNIIAKVARRAVRGGEANYVSQIYEKYSAKE